MELVLFSIVGILAGLFVMWIAIFGKKEDVKEFDSGFPSSIEDFFLTVFFKLFPPFLRRVLLFLLGLAIVMSLIYLCYLELTGSLV